MELIARALRVRRLSTRSGGARKTKGDPRLRGDDIRLEPGGDFPLQNKIQSNRLEILDCSNGRKKNSYITIITQEAL
jgi:hypothetical protein